MKPCSKAAADGWLSRHDRVVPEQIPGLRITCEFQPNRFGDFGGGGLPWRRPNFSRLATEVLRADASRSFRVESAVLGFVSLVAAWPVAVMIHEVIRLLR